jgi:hypothetical protein
MVLKLVIDLEVFIRVGDVYCKRPRAHGWILQYFVVHMKDA